MKRLFLFIVCFFCLVVSIYSQTEMWRIAGPAWNFMEDGNGNTYLIKGLNLDTLIKINSNGETLFSIPLTVQRYGIQFSGSGIYLFPWQYWYSAANDTIFYYDTLGAMRWKYQLPSNTIPRSYTPIDGNGNLFYAFDSLPNPSTNVPLVSKLLKLNTNGEKLFEVPFFSKPTQGTMNSWWYLGPVVDDEGNVWIVSKPIFYTVTKNGTLIEQTETISSEALRFDGQTGALLLRTKFYEGIRIYGKSDSIKGDLKWNVFEYPFEAITTCNNRLVASGTFQKEWQSWNNGKETDKYNSEWRIAIIDKFGKIRNFKYQGNGKERFHHNNRTYSGNGNNVLWSVSVGNGDALYIHGEVSRGQSIEFSAPLHTDDVILKLDAAKVKRLWNITISDATLPIMFYKPSEKILRNKDPHTINVYNANGDLASTPIVFADPVEIPIEVNALDRILGGKYLAKGYLIVNVDSGYSAKYYIGDVLAKQGYALQSNHVDIAQIFSLDQNYPNPFNPSTMIEFSLVEPSLVTLKVYNLLGQEVQTLLNNEMMDDGEQSFEFDAGGLPSGVYFYKITAQGESKRQFQSVKRMLLLK